MSVRTATAVTASPRALLPLVVVLAVGCSDTRLFPIRAQQTPMDASVEQPASDATPAADTIAPQDVLPPIACPPVPPPQVGYAVTTTGGNVVGFPVTLVTAHSELELKSYAGQADPLVIQIADQIVLTQPIEVASNKTIVGVAPAAELTGSGLVIKDNMNVIVQQLRISKAAGPDDAITIQAAQHVWVDHCDLSSVYGAADSAYDGLIDIVHGSEWITVSWTKLHDHNRVGLVGHTSDAAQASQDTGKFHITYHHNWFNNVLSNTPRVRYGSVHIFNNLFDNVHMNAIAAVLGAKVFVESNVFRMVPDPIETTYMGDTGGAVNISLDNSFDPPPSPDLAVTDWKPDYPYASDLSPTFMVPALVMACAGPQF